MPGCDVDAPVAEGVVDTLRPLVDEDQTTAPISEPSRVPTPPMTRPMMRGMAKATKLKSCSATKPESMAHKTPATPPRAALTPKVMVLYIGRLTPLTAAPVSLSRMAMMARPGRLLIRLRVKRKARPVMMAMTK